LRDDLPCEFLPDALVGNPPDVNRLRALYQRWGFKGMIEELAVSSCEQQTMLI
jgi:hypothetical protein